ncbi:GNAT family N-acetyltransferase [Manganibacter manganicus]|uniref:GNAT family N-acetyltransferase n=1 Tax=Manganibacter manganicus TaxID=1873176 RepID=A0A1V8RSI3_9HYPH|nr:GNAT family N-acetyltransferase [Pseudaminobacter manganicus]OQM76171.1 GNAT family N-acetyltransferase [Pseudaminobacter manganicus]
MVAVPIFEEVSGGGIGTMMSGLAGLPRDERERAQIELWAGDRPSRKLAIYPASAGFDLVEELDYLANRTVESNIFFNPRFLAPAMPRLENREVRLAVIRDGDDYRSRLRLLGPFSIERPAVPLGVPVMRSWANPFGPMGAPLIDRDDPLGVLEDFFTMLARPHLKLPRLFVVPDLRLDGPVAALLKTLSETRDLPLVVTGENSRPMLKSDLDGDIYLKNSLRAHHYREFRRLKRRLADHGKLEHETARGPEEVRYAIEDFLALEASGWKGRERTAMAVDRFRAAFAREAVHGLADLDMCRIHKLTLDGRTIACLIVFIEQGVAYTWKTAYDETLSAYSPGTLLMIEVTKQHLDDPNIIMTDSCAVPDHPVMSRLWSEHSPMGTFVIGIAPGTDRLTRQAATQIHLYRETRNMARILRNRVKDLVGRYRKH